MEHNEIFISYRRADVEFAKMLYGELKNTNRSIWVDWENIPPGVEGFSDEIQRGIEGADAFICVLSPSYLESEYCLMELREALKLKKRVIPVVLIKFDPMPAPEGIGHINWIYFTPHAGHQNKFEDSFAKVIKALEADYGHTREHTRLLLRAVDWQKNERGRSYLLKDAEIGKAERWQVTAIGKNPPPTELHGEYILASRANQRRQQRRIMAVIGVLLALSVVAAIFAMIQRGVAITEREYAQTQEAIALTEKANAEIARATAEVAKEEAIKQKLIAEDEAQNALISSLAAQSQLIQSRQLRILVALEAYIASEKKGEVSPAVKTSLRSALVDFGGVPVQSYEFDASSVQFSPDGRWLISQGDGEYRISDLTQGLDARTILLEGLDWSSSITFSPDSQWLAGIYSDETVLRGIRVWNLGDPDVPPSDLALPDNDVQASAIAFSGVESGRNWLTGGFADGSIYTWNVSNLPQAEPVLLKGADQFGRAAQQMVFSPDGNWLAVAFQYDQSFAQEVEVTASPTLLLLNLKNLAGDPIPLDLVQSPINNLTFSARGKWLVGSSEDGVDGKLRIWNMDLVLTAPTASAFEIDDNVRDIAISPDERWVAVVGSSKAQVWSLNNFSRFELPGYKDYILTTVFSPDSRWLATGDWDGQIRMWNTQDFSNTGTPPLEALSRIYNGFDVKVNSMEFSADASRLAAAGDKQVRVWGLPVSVSDPIRTAALANYVTRDDILLLQSSLDGLIAMDLQGDDPFSVLKTTHKNPINFYNSPDERYLAVVSSKQVQVWDLNDPGQPMFESERMDGQFIAPIFTADNRWFVYGVYNEIFAFDLQGGNTSPIVLSGNRKISPIQIFYTSGHWLISRSTSEILAWDTNAGLSAPLRLSASAGSALIYPFDNGLFSFDPGESGLRWIFIQQPGSLTAWDLTDLSAAPVVIRGEYSNVETVQDRWLITANLEGASELWNLSEPDLPIASPNGYGISATGDRIFYYDMEGTLLLLNLSDGNLKPVELGQHTAFAFSPDDQWLATSTQDESGENPLTVLHGVQDAAQKIEIPDVYPIQFSPDGRWFLLQDVEGNMVLYDLVSRELLPGAVPIVDSIQFSPDGRWLSGILPENNSTSALLLDLSDPREFYYLRGHTDNIFPPYFAPDGRSLLTYGWDGTIRIWDLDNPDNDPVVLRHDARVDGVYLTGNDKWLVSATSSETSNSVYVWRWDFRDVPDMACRLAGRNLTLAEWVKYIGDKGEYSKTCENWPLEEGVD